jgi:hypothetical protein
MIMMLFIIVIVIIIVIVCTFHGYLKVLVRMKHGGDLPDWLLHIDVTIGILRVKKLNMFL